jgi:hypothetical protein
MYPQATRRQHNCHKPQNYAMQRDRDQYLRFGSSLFSRRVCSRHRGSGRRPGVGQHAAGDLRDDAVRLRVCLRVQTLRLCEQYNDNLCTMYQHNRMAGMA